MDISYKQILPQIKHVLLDVDGVLTDGRVTFDANGIPQRSLLSKDAFILQLAIRMGIRIGIVTGGKANGLLDHFKQIGIVDVYRNASYKKDALEDYCAIYDVPKSEILYVGDDLPDYEVMQEVGMAACPADASPDIRSISAYVSPYKGGEGCVRDIVEQLLRVKGLYNQKENWTW